MESEEAKWATTKIDSPGEPLYNSLQQYNELEGMQVIAWNDEFPDGRSYSYAGHNKGVMVVDA